MESEIVKLDRVTLFYQQRQSETVAIKELSFSVRRGEFVAIVGPSGCGKTSVLSLLMGLISSSEGLVTVNGEKPNVKNDIGYMLQRDHLLDWRTVEENVLLSLEVKGLRTKERCENAMLLLKTYGLSDFRHHFPGELSGGMRQKVALIRTLAFDPSLLLLDEPFSALDYQTRLRAADEISGIIRKEGKTAILVTHDISEAVSMADRVLVFTERPAKLKGEHILEFDASLTPLERRNAAGFSRYFNLIWKELNADETC